MKMTARACAYQVLHDVQVSEAYVNLALQQALRQNELNVRDKGLCTEIVYGTLQRRRTLDVLIGQVCNRPVSDLEPSILTILRMSVYQLSFLDKVPVYAVLNEAVELTKRVRRKAAGFVNGILRAYVRDERSWRQRVEQYEGETRADQLGVWLSYPTWLVTRLLQVYGEERTIQILDNSNQKSQLSVRVNTLRANVTEVLADVSARLGGTTESCTAEVKAAEASVLSPVGVRLKRGLDIEKWPFYEDGKVSVQDEGAMLIAPLLEAEPGQKILDMCAAPGSKTMHIAEIIGDDGTVIAADVHSHKVQLISSAANRLHLESVQTMTMDGRMFSHFPNYSQAFDAVLLDAPCTGFGVLRHRPDIRWRRQESDIAELAKLQLQLLEAAVQVVKPGGVIVYATCTLLPEENQNVVEQVLAAHPELTVDLLEGIVGEGIPSASDGPGFTLTPDMFDTDGFYMCRIRKPQSPPRNPSAENKEKL